MKSKNAGLLTVASLCFVLAGCSNTPDKASADMGPAPTGPPAGSPYGATTASMSPDAFVAKLESMPAADRSAFIQANSSVMTSIMGGPDTPAKTKLTAIINKH